MDTLPLLKINISANNAVDLEFQDPATGVQANRRPGSFILPEPPTHPESDPLAHGGALRDALLSSAPVRDEFLAALNTTIHADPPRPLRISLGLPAEQRALHDLGWETLLDPNDDQPLLSRHNVYFFRFLESNESIGTPPVWPRALLFIANPECLANQTIRSAGVHLQPVDVDGELRRARLSLKPLVPEVITSLPGQKGVASLDRLLSALGDPGTKPYHVLYLVCHGQTSGNSSRLWLDQLNDEPVDAQLLVDGLRDLGERHPRLVVLASCQSAGQPGTGNEASVDRGALAAIGPKLVQQAGIAAVVAMQGNVYMRSVEAMMPVFFRQLVHSGQVEQAMAIARGRLRIHTDPLIREQWRVPVLFSRLANGQIWPASQFKSRTVYLSHAILPTDPEASALTATRKWLNDAGYEVIDGQDSREKDEPWSRRLLDGLGTCDAAVLLLNEQALTGADNGLHVEASILCWRHWLEDDFRLIPLYLGADSPPQLQQVPWSLVCEAGAPLLDSTRPDGLEARLRELLEPLVPGAESSPLWRLSNLYQRVVGHFEQMGKDSLLREIARRLQAEYGLPLLPDQQVDPARWWARAALCHGPVVLGRLYHELGSLASQEVSEAIKGLLGPTAPAWVDITAAAQIVYLAMHVGQTPGSFYLRGLNPLKDELTQWIAGCYAARACGFDYDLFRGREGPCILVVVPLFSGLDDARLSEIQTALRARLQAAQPELWADAWSEATGADRDDPEAWIPELVPDDDPRVKDTIEWYVKQRAANRRPVLVVLSGAMATRQELLAEARGRFGPLCFFYMGRDPAPAVARGDLGLVSILPTGAFRAYSDYNRLKDL